MKLAIVCPEHGLRILGSAQLCRQLRSEDRWRCPDCGRPCGAEPIFEQALEDGCRQCGRAFEDGQKVVLGRLDLGLFCDQLCEGAYAEKLRSAVR